MPYHIGIGLLICRIAGPSKYSAPYPFLSATSNFAHDIISSIGHLLIRINSTPRTLDAYHWFYCTDEVNRPDNRHLSTLKTSTLPCFYYTRPLGRLKTWERLSRKRTTVSYELFDWPVNRHPPHRLNIILYIHFAILLLYSTSRASDECF